MRTMYIQPQPTPNTTTANHALLKVTYHPAKRTDIRCMAQCECGKVLTGTTRQHLVNKYIHHTNTAAK